MLPIGGDTYTTNRCHVLYRVTNKKAQLMQREMCDSGACTKAHCKRNLNQPIPAIDIGHDFHSFIYIRQRSHVAAVI